MTQQPLPICNPLFEPSAQLARPQPLQTQQQNAPFRGDTAASGSAQLEHATGVSAQVYVENPMTGKFRRLRGSEAHQSILVTTASHGVGQPSAVQAYNAEASLLLMRFILSSLCKFIQGCMGGLALADLIGILHLLTTSTNATLVETYAPFAAVINKALLAFTSLAVALGVVRLLSSSILKLSKAERGNHDRVTILAGVCDWGAGLTEVLALILQAKLRVTWWASMAHAIVWVGQTFQAFRLSYSDTFSDWAASASGNSHSWTSGLSKWVGISMASDLLCSVAWILASCEWPVTSKNNLPSVRSSARQSADV